MKRRNYYPITSRDGDNITISKNNTSVALKFVSCNHNMCLWRTDDTKVHDGYLHNIYSQFLSSQVKFHQKLKIYYHEIHGYYVVAQGIRCYANGLIRTANK